MLMKGDLTPMDDALKITAESSDVFVLKNEVKGIIETLIFAATDDDIENVNRDIRALQADMRELVQKFSDFSHAMDCKMEAQEKDIKEIKECLGIGVDSKLWNERWASNIKGGKK